MLIHQLQSWQNFPMNQKKKKMIKKKKKRRKLYELIC